MSVDTVLKTTELDVLQRVRDRESLFGFLRDELRWNVDPEDTFTYSGPVLSEDIAAQVEVSQIIPFSAADPFVIMLAEFHTPFRRSSLREILRKIKEDMRRRAKYEGKSLEDIVFVCATEDYRGIRFAHFQEQGTRQPKLSVFGWELDNVDETRTLREFNLPSLKMQFNVLGEPDWQAIRQSWLSAWDVERVTDGFFKEYNKVFCEVEEMIQGVKGNKRLFTQRLFNRLLFVQFIQKKKWLEFDGSTNYLPALLQAAESKGENFYDDRLHWLFFHGLGTPISAVESKYSDPDYVFARRGKVPFLNGGLFELEDEDDHRGIVSIPNAAFDRIINGLFAQYNFTVTESTPLDIEVAVDPEMLGKIFEELVTGRHETGSYYTPKPIVSFMCREALKGYVRERVPGISEEAASLFVDEHDPSGIKNPEQVLEALRRVKVCDPACGSGAYLLGMLRELLDLRACLFSVRQVDAASIYDRKLEIIQGNLYGVDKDIFAVNIARLRLWLSLVVEYTGAGDPPPLPNLDFKIECGDSVVCPNPQLGVGQGGLREQLVRQFVQKKGEFLCAHNEEKHRLLNEINELRRDIAEMEGRRGNEMPFDWTVDFAEVFSVTEPVASIGGGFNFGYELAEQPEPGGFDIVVANPPYVEQRLIKDLKPSLKSIYGQSYSGMADLYVYFYYRAVELLRPRGMLAFISSNKWLRADYGLRLKEHLSSRCGIRAVLDFKDLPVFRNAIAYAMVLVAEKGGEPSSSSVTVVPSLEPPYPDVRAIVNQFGRMVSHAEMTSGPLWQLDGSGNGSFAKNFGGSLTLGDMIDRVYRGVTTGLNEAFVIDEETRLRLIQEDSRSAELIKPLLLGRNVSRWWTQPKGKWLIFTRRGVSISEYPAIERHLSYWREELMPRRDGADKGRKPGRYEWYEIQDETAYWSVFERPKIISTKMSLKPCFAVDNDGHYLGNTCYVIPAKGNIMYLLALLNSSTFERYARSVFVEKQNGWFEVQPSGLMSFPVPEVSIDEQTVLAQLAQKCFDAKGVGCERWEKEIDERVAALYGL